MCNLSNRTNVVFDETVVTTLQRANIDHHVHFPCPIEDRATRFVRFNVRQSGAEWKPDDGTNRNAAAEEITCSDTHPRRVNAHGREVIRRGFLAELLDVVVSRFRLE